MLWAHVTGISRWRVMRITHQITQRREQRYFIVI